MCVRMCTCDVRVVSLMVTFECMLYAVAVVHCTALVASLSMSGAHACTVQLGRSLKPHPGRHRTRASLPDRMTDTLLHWKL